MKIINGKCTAFEILEGLNLPWESALHMGKRFMFPKGQRIQPKGEMWYIKKGCVCLSQQNLDGQEKIIWLLKNGCIIGETSFYYHHKVEAYCVSMSECQIYSFSENNIKSLARENPELVTNLLSSMAQKMGILIRHVASLCLDSARIRLCKFIAQRIDARNGELVAHIEMSRQEIANFLGINRISLYKLIRSLEEEKILKQVSNRTFLIIEPELFHKILME